MTDDLDRLEIILSRWGRRLRLDDGLRLAARSLWPAAAGVLLLEGIARYWPIPDRHLWALLPLEIWLLGVALLSLLRPLSLWQVARRLDRELGLKDRLATALELQKKGMEDWKIGRLRDWRLGDWCLRPIFQPTFQPSNLPTFQPSYLPTPQPSNLPTSLRSQPSNLPNLISLQLGDALAAARRISPNQLARRLPRRPLWLAGGLLALAVILALLPNPMDVILAQRAAVRQAAQEQAKAIDQARQEFAQAADPTSEDRAEALQALAELMKALAANPGDLEQALADIAAAEARLRELQDLQAAARQTAVEQVAGQLTALARGETQAATDLGEAAAALTELAAGLGARDAAGQAELAGALESAAAEAAATDAELAEALQELAQAARAGDVGRAVKAAGQAQGALARAGQSARLQNALAAAQAGLARSRQQLAQSGPPAQGGGQPGQNSGQGQGQQAGGGGGTTANQLPPANRQGAARPPSQPNRPAGTSASETVYAPFEAQLAGKSEFVAGQENQEGQVIVRQEKSPQPGATGPSLVPYGDVYQTYAKAAAETMDRERIPPEMQDYIRDYFSRLAPE
ncbi:MAG: PT domain-containing protein [Chloroflexota bacterium]